MDVEDWLSPAQWNPDGAQALDRGSAFWDKMLKTPDSSHWSFFLLFFSQQLMIPQTETRCMVASDALPSGRPRPRLWAEGTAATAQTEPPDSCPQGVPSGLHHEALAQLCFSLLCFTSS